MFYCEHCISSSIFSIKTNFRVLLFPCSQYKFDAHLLWSIPEKHNLFLLSCHRPRHEIARHFIINWDELFSLICDCITMERLSSRFDCCRQKQIRLWIILTQVFGSLLLVPINPAASAILKNGESSNGYYWQKTSTNWKPVIIRYQCRSSVSGKIEKQQKCRDAGAVKPQ